MEDGTVPEPKDLIVALRKRLKMTQEDVLAKSEGAFVRREDMSKFENGQNQATSDRAREGLAKAFGVDRKFFAMYLDGKIDLEQLVKTRELNEPVLHIPQSLFVASCKRKTRGREPFPPEVVQRVAERFPVEPTEGWAGVLETTYQEYVQERREAKRQGTLWKKKHTRATPEPTAPPAAPSAPGSRKAVNH